MTNWRSNTAITTGSSSSHTNGSTIPDYYYKWFGPLRFQWYYAIEFRFVGSLLLLTIGNFYTMYETNTSTNRTTTTTTSKSNNYLSFSNIWNITIYLPNYKQIYWFVLVVGILLLRHCIIRWILLNDNSTYRYPTILGSMANFYQTIISGGGYIYDKPISYEQMSSNLSYYKQEYNPPPPTRMIPPPTTTSDISSQSSKQQQQQQSTRKDNIIIPASLLSVSDYYSGNCYYSYAHQNPITVVLTTPTTILATPTSATTIPTLVPSSIANVASGGGGISNSNSNTTNATTTQSVSLQTFVANNIIPFPIKYVLQWIRVTIWYNLFVRFINYERYIRFQHRIMLFRSSSSNNTTNSGTQQQQQQQQSERNHPISPTTRQQQQQQQPNRTQQQQQNSTNATSHRGNRTTNRNNSNNNQQPQNQSSSTSSSVYVALQDFVVSCKQLLIIFYTYILLPLLALLQRLLQSLTSTTIIVFPSLSVLVFAECIHYITLRFHTMYYNLPDSFYYLFIASDNELIQETNQRSLLLVGQSSYSNYNNDDTDRRLLRFNNNPNEDDTMTSGTSRNIIATRPSLFPFLDTYVNSYLYGGDTEKVSSSLSNTQPTIEYIKGSNTNIQPATDQVVFIMISVSIIVSILFFVRLTIPHTDLIASSNAANDCIMRNQYEQIYSKSILNRIETIWNYVSNWIHQFLSLPTPTDPDNNNTTTNTTTRSGNPPTGKHVSHQSKKVSSTNTARTIATTTPTKGALSQRSTKNRLASFYYTVTSSSSSSSGPTNPPPTIATRSTSLSTNTTAAGIAGTNSPEYLETMIPWSERIHPLRVRNRYIVSFQVIVIRIIENVVLCGILPRTKYICRYTGLCPTGFPIWELVTILYPSTVVTGSRQTNTPFTGFVESDVITAVAIVVSIIVITFELLVTQTIIQKRSYFASLGYISCQWEKVITKKQTKQQAQWFLYRQSSFKDQEDVELELMKVTATPWDPQRAYEVNDIVYYPTEESVLSLLRLTIRRIWKVMYHRTSWSIAVTTVQPSKVFYRATVFTPIGHPYHNDFLHWLQKWFATNEVGHISTSPTIYWLAYFQLFYTILYTLFVTTYTIYLQNHKPAVVTTKYYFGMFLSVVANLIALQGILQSIQNPNHRRTMLLYDINKSGSLDRLNKELCAT